MNNPLGQNMEAKEEPTENWSEVPEEKNPDDLDFSFPLAKSGHPLAISGHPLATSGHPMATSLMDSLNCSPPAPFTLATLDELATWPSTSSSSQVANNQPDRLKAATLPRRGPMTWPQVSSSILIMKIFSWYQFHLLVSSRNTL